MTKIRVATRTSDLALAQARQVAAWVGSALGVETELVPTQTTGDRLNDVPLSRIGGKGLFVKEIEEALLEGRADLAVHSAKDLPATTPPGLALLAFPERADPRDALVARERGTRLADLLPGSRVGTGSVRRAAQLRAHRSDLTIVALRGNVPTRLRKLHDEGLDAVVLACAGLERLGLGEQIDERIPPEILLPAVGQGAIAVEGRANDPIARDVASLSHPPTAASVAAERGFLVGLAGDCNVPLAALAEHQPGGSLRLRALLSASDGSRILRYDEESEAAGAMDLGAAAARAVLQSGGEALLEALRAEAAS